jgi:hypothetical protein
VELIDKVMVYDVSGKLIQERRRLKIQVDTFRYKCTRTGFIVKVFLINGTTISKKSFIRNPKHFLNPIRCCEWDFLFIWFYY